jgi:hypothetical protein
MLGTTRVTVTLFAWAGYERKALVSIGKIMLASLIMTAAMLVIRLTIGTGAAATAVTLLVGVIVYFSLVRLLRLGEGMNLKRFLKFSLKRHKKR